MAERNASPSTKYTATISEQQAHEHARLAHSAQAVRADVQHPGQGRGHRDRDVARVPDVGAADEGDRKSQQQQRQHDAGAREVRHDAPDHGHDDAVDLDHA